LHSVEKSGNVPSWNHCALLIHDAAVGCGRSHDRVVRPGPAGDTGLPKVAGASALSPAPAESRVRERPPDRSVNDSNNRKVCRRVRVAPRRSERSRARRGRASLGSAFCSAVRFGSVGAVCRYEATILRSCVVLAHIRARQGDLDVKFFRGMVLAATVFGCNPISPRPPPGPCPSRIAAICSPFGTADRGMENRKSRPIRIKQQKATLSARHVRDNQDGPRWDRFSTELSVDSAVRLVRCDRCGWRGFASRCRSGRVVFKAKRIRRERERSPVRLRSRRMRWRRANLSQL